MRQSDVKTEVYHAGSTPLYEPVEAEPIADEPSSPASTGGWEVPPVPVSEAYVPDETQANVDFAPSVPATPFGADDTFASSTAVPSDPFATRTAQPETQQEAVREIPRPAPVVMKPKKKSKAPLVVGALAAVFILGMIAIGAGWFAYTNYYANAAAEATPTPEPTVEFTPTPEPTLEVVSDTNANTLTAESNSNSTLEANSNTDIPRVEPTPIPEIQTTTRENTPGTRTQQNETRRTATNPKGNPGTKSTPNKKTNRTVIMQ